MLDCVLAEKPTLDAADSAAIRAAAEPNLQNLRSDDVAASQAARRALVQPLACEKVSVDFRLKFSNVVARELTTMVADKRDHVALNAVRLAGEMATQAAVDSVLRPALSDARPAVRLMAASGYRQTLRIVTSPGGGSMSRANLEAVVDAVAARLATEPDVGVVEHLVLALDAIAATGENAELNRVAMQKLAAAGSTQVKALRSRANEPQTVRWASALIRATDAVARPMTALGGPSVLNAEFRTAAAVFAGHTLAYARDRLVAAGDQLGAESAEAGLLKTLVNTSERVLLLADAGVAQGGGAPRQTLLPAFERAIAGGSADEFVAEADKWIGASGTLTKAPYNAKAADFSAPRR
jgi:hypothetical protein